jgi:ribose 1,5-bisphosphokinase PhnN
MGYLGEVRAGYVTTWSPALGAAVELHYLAAPVDVLFERLQRRGRENPPIERDALSRWFEIFQVPTPEEMALFDEPLATNPSRPN